MIKAILIPSNPTETATIVEFQKDDLTTMQGFVEGTVTVVNIDRPPAALYVNEDGQALGMPPNPRGTYLLWTGNMAYLNADFLVGPVLVTGRPDEEGDITSVPDELLQLLFETEEYRVQVQTQEDGSWAPSAMRFQDWPGAYEYAARLAIRWTAVLHVRVVAA